ncbi:MAG TPA: hypothetical protein VGM38_02355 [Pseudolysinimonas sp.]
MVDQTYGHAGAKTTGDVAEILQAKYGLFSVFAEMHGPVIAHEVENSLQGALETMFMQRRPNLDRIRANAFNSATGGIEELFRDAIDMQSYDWKIRGVPTQAALNGVRHSWKRPRKRGGPRRSKVQYGDPRASFFDTGLLSSSFRAWVD